MAYVDAVNYNTIKSMKGYPVGSIIPWSGAQDSIPSGWIPCSGSNLSISRYPLLYKIIGNVYGGTTGVSFKLPTLNAGDTAAMDIFQGHFNYLQSQGDAHKPENTIKSTDPFWSTVGAANNGDSPSTTQTNWISTIDIVGEFLSRPNVVARHGTFTLSEGEVSIALSVNERKLSDVHVPSHSHSDGDIDSPSYGRDFNVRAREYANYFGVLSDFLGGTTFSRCALNGDNANVSRSTNEPPKDGREMATVGSSQRVGTSYRQGGGDIIDDGANGNGQYAATGFSNGDGYSRGDLYSFRGVTRYFWSSLAPEFVNFSQIPGHSHGVLEYNWISRLRIINPGIVNDVSMNTVQINNSTGANFGTINMNSATPTLTLTFIIKAY
jgi:microcystin-dependent protein